MEHKVTFIDRDISGTFESLVIAKRFVCETLKKGDDELRWTPIVLIDEDSGVDYVIDYYGHILAVITRVGE